MTRTGLSGWGRTSTSYADLVSPNNESDIALALATSRDVIARGLGRSYGDAALLSGGVVISNRELNGIGPIDGDGVVTVGAGVSIDELLTQSIPRGWFVPVSPGTRQVTVGGAVAADVHGKNHHVDGSFAHHVLSMRLVTPSGPVTVSPDENAELFWATFGAMGLTGVLTSVTLRLTAIETDRVLVDTDRLANLDAVMSAMALGDDAYRYSVAWVDCMSRGKHMGRAILTRAVHAMKSDLDGATLSSPKDAKLFVPFDAPSGLLNPLSVRAFNEVWFRSAPRHEEREAQSLSTFFHPLDGVRDWNRLYGRRGFVQYQFCVPERSSETVVAAVDLLSSSKVASFLAVLKRFGPANPSPLSFPLEGWTLALDLPIGSSKLPDILDQLDNLVLEAGGRVYLAKDARLSPEKFAAMYPRRNEFLALKERFDPEHRMSSDLARRLDLVGR
jgi:decaprenylphospho-beta-D-ribofuranose 2-oxidase